MKSLFNIHGLTAVLLLALPLGLFASGAGDNNSNESKVSFDCDANPSLRTPSRFKGIEKLAIDVDTKLCQGLLTLDGDIAETRDILIDFGRKSEVLLLERFSNDSVQKAISAQFDHYSDEILKFKGDLIDNGYPKLGTTLPDSSVHFSKPGRNHESIIADNFDTSCTTVTGDDKNQTPYSACTIALEDAALAFNNYEVSITRYHTLQNDPKLDYLSSAWNRYLDKARSQTILDVWFTSNIHDDYYSQRKLVAPHPRQYFLLRPQAVYEFNQDTKKGDRTQVGLAVEWLGVNWWDAKVPFGMSLISVYADYEEEDSVGHGVQFTFNNSASIGWIDRGDTESIFVTLDFLKLWEDKSAKLAQYKKNP
jgi:hypothetical protein